MRLACPSCQAAYEVPDALLVRGGRRMRCARCATEWIGGPAPRDVETSAVVEPATPPVIVAPVPASPSGALPTASRAEPRASLSAERRPDPRVPPPRRKTRGFTVVLAWLLTFAVLGTAAAACYKWRDEVMTAWPPSQRVFVALGLR